MHVGVSVRPREHALEADAAACLQYIPNCWGGGGGGGLAIMLVLVNQRRLQEAALEVKKICWFGVSGGDGGPTLSLATSA